VVAVRVAQKVGVNRRGYACAPPDGAHQAPQSQRGGGSSLAIEALSVDSDVPDALSGEYVFVVRHVLANLRYDRCKLDGHRKPALVTLVFAANLLLATLLRYTAPVSFVDLATADVEDALTNGFTAVARWRVPMLEEMIKLALRRGDSAGVTAGLHGLSRIHRAYINASAKNPAARRHLILDDETNVIEAWLGHDLRGALLRSAETSFSVPGTSDDYDFIIAEYEEALARSLAAGHDEETMALIDGLSLLGCSTLQVGAGYVNFQGRPAGVLARSERRAEEHGQDEIAAQALASWVLVCTYYTVHFSKEGQPVQPHPLWDDGIEDFGPNAPWTRADEIIGSRPWQRHWNNQMELGVGPVKDVFKLSRDVYDERHRQGGVAGGAETAEEAAEGAGEADAEPPTDLS
jgi:hypothetical protein